MLYIILAILMFGLLIAVHEFDTSSQRSCLGSRSMNFPLEWAPLFGKNEKGKRFTAYAFCRSADTVRWRGG